VDEIQTRQNHQSIVDKTPGLYPSQKAIARAKAAFVLIKGELRLRLGAQLYPSHRPANVDCQHRIKSAIAELNMLMSQVALAERKGVRLDAPECYRQSTARQQPPTTQGSAYPTQ